MLKSSFPVAAWITPSGHPYARVAPDFLDADVAATLSKNPALEKSILEKHSPLGARLFAAFGAGVAEGLLLLGTTELSTLLSADFDFLRAFAQIYFTKLCHLPALASPVPVKNLPPLDAPSAEELAAFLETKPPFAGAEYLTEKTLAIWWKNLDNLVREKIAAHPAGAADWLQKQNPLWRAVGRVTFHLAENKRDENFPFAFMATYVDQVSATAQPAQMPLARALEQYVSAQDRAALLRLLQPLNAAAERCDWVKKMVADQTIYRPRAWTIQQAHRFLQDLPALEECGLIIRVPNWWQKNNRSRPRLKISVGADQKTLTAAALLNFDLAMVYNDENLSEAEIAELLAAETQLVRLRGHWVEIDREKLQTALTHWRQLKRRMDEDGITFAEGMRLLAGLPAAANLTATKEENTFREWSEVVPTARFAEQLAGLRDPQQLADCRAKNLKATLRPYQEVGVKWLDFMTRLGLGACLADDMGLGKTVQVIALLLAQKENSPIKNRESLLVAPASLLGNWEAEIKKFAPTLTTRIVHRSGTGTEASGGEKIDLVMTTYGMLDRVEWLKKKEWRHVILDEAQAIKNAGTKQARAVKALSAVGRIALTGTPVENRLTDLWSLFDFLNPGLLGAEAAFNKFIKTGTDEKNRAAVYAPLRRLTQPYLLRRLKTDKKIIADLPEKTEVTAWCGLAKAQAKIYAQLVKQLETDLRGNRDGIKRRGVILSYLMQFKQLCNHPAHHAGTGDYDAERSGKFARLREIAEEIAARREKVLVFTQFSEITTPLANFLAAIFQRAGLILHGGVAVKKRQALVEEFQSELGAPFFILSLKAGGTGLNLTAAAHVIHFDRWWNPAVENQATDRAFRIGQKNPVLVHKFVCRGTIEEKIDALIESKKALADQVIGGGENLVTEMSDEQLLAMVALDLERAIE